MEQNNSFKFYFKFWRFFKSQMKVLDVLAGRKFNSNHFRELLHGL